MTALDASWLRQRPLPKPGNGGKDDRGQVVIIGGEASLGGAVLLAAEAALRAGAGKVMMSVAPEVTAAMTIAMPEAMVCARPDPGQGDQCPVLRRLKTCDALLLGPGMFDDEGGMVRSLLDREHPCPTVIDAGALKALDRKDSARQPWILTPHAGEMATLLDRDKETVEADPLAAAQEAVRRFGAVVAMKGPQTWIAGPDAEPVLYAGGGPGLGTSGSGDVLGGLIVGLLARGTPPFEAAAWGVFLHGEAGMRLASRIGPLGFLARELSPEVPAILAGFP